MKWLVLGVSLGLLCLAQGRESEDGRVIATRSTKTAIILTTSTTTTPYTCALLTNAATCQRRRYRRYTNIKENQLQDEEALLDGSLMEGEEHSRTERDAPVLPGERDPRIALTIWTTSSSTFTVTSTSINTAVTFSLSYYCTVNGVAFPPACG